MPLVPGAGCRAPLGASADPAPLSTWPQHHPFSCDEKTRCRHAQSKICTYSRHLALHAAPCAVSSPWYTGFFMQLWCCGPTFSNAPVEITAWSHAIWSGNFLSSSLLELIQTLISILGASPGTAISWPALPFGVLRLTRRPPTQDAGRCLCTGVRKMPHLLHFL